MKNYGKLIVVMIFFIVTISAISFSNSKITIRYNDVNLSSDVNPIIINGRTMVPARSVFEKAGYKIKWDESTKTVIAVKGSIKVTMKINDPIVKIDDPLGPLRVELDVVPQVINDRTLIPLIVIKNLDHRVFWEGTTKTVDIYTNKYYAKLKTKRLTNDVEYNADGSMFITRYTLEEFRYDEYPTKNTNIIITDDTETMDEIMKEKKIKLDREKYTPIILVGKFLFLENKDGGFSNGKSSTDYLDLTQGALVNARSYKVNKIFSNNNKLEGFFAIESSTIFRFSLLDSNYKEIKSFMPFGGYVLNFEEVGEGHIKIQFRNIYDHESDMFNITNLTYTNGKLFADINGENMLFSEFIDNIEYHEVK